MVKSVGKDLAWKQMEKHGWSLGQGLGKHSQGRLEAIKPKLKFDLSGVGHDRGEEFEFHWWDHVFNKAAQGIKVDQGHDGVKVEFSTDKSDLSTKKMRKRMQKEMKNRLYSHFVKSGTLSGGVFSPEKGQDAAHLEEKDMSSVKVLTDDDLVKACGGRTAHKGARHGQTMSSKLSRVEEADRLFMEQMLKAKAGSQGPKAEPPKSKNSAAELTMPTESLSERSSKKKKKKDKNRDNEEKMIEIPVASNSESSTQCEGKDKSSKKKSKKKKNRNEKDDPLEAATNAKICDTSANQTEVPDVQACQKDSSTKENLNPTDVEESKSSKKKKKKRKIEEDGPPSVESDLAQKKRKTNSDQIAICDDVVDAVEGKAKRKKAKKSKV